MSSLNKFTLLAFLFTGLNALCGVIGIIVSIFYANELPYLAMQLLIFGAIFDFLDGRLAKMAPISLALGAYFDSIGDVITFAILPGIMLLNSPLFGNEIAGLSLYFALGIAGFYSLCGWGRLMRFATRPTDIYFEGLPSPAAALLIGSSAILAIQPEMTWIFWANGLSLTLITLITSVLMILTVAYPTPKRGKTPDMVAIGITGIIVMIFVFFPSTLTLSAILFIALLYTILGPTMYLKVTSDTSK
ncbi:MAG: CDP-alcohol phosphatidyltransferase family protein [Candidatus Hodarchaeota archaeon]